MDHPNPRKDLEISAYYLWKTYFPSHHFYVRGYTQPVFLSKDFIPQEGVEFVLPER
jgi:hypothetical protein